MMKKVLTFLSVVLVVLGLSTAGLAYTINYSFATNGNEYTSPYAGVTVETFDSALLWSWSGSPGFVTGSVSGQYAAPFGVSAPDATTYVTVPINYNTGNWAAASLGGVYNYFGIWWGSVDAYNTLEFYLGQQLVASIGGVGATSPSAANGNQTAPSSNLYINFLNLPYFDSFKMISTQFAFEADNIAVGVVPEPATLLLLGLGLVGIAGVGRKA